MAAIEVLITIVIVTMAVITVGMVVAVIAATVMTTVAVRQEERLRTLKWWAPGRLAQLVRTILGVYVRRMDLGTSAAAAPRGARTNSEAPGDPRQTGLRAAPSPGRGAARMAIP
jgi:hypothetical protein